MGKTLSLATHDRDRLREQAARDLVNSGGVPLVFIYPLLAFMVGRGSELWDGRRGLIYGTMLLTLLVGLVRHRVGRQLRLAPSSRLARFVTFYAGCVVALAGCWSGYCCCIVNEFGRSWSGMLALLTTTGLVAASTSNLTSNCPLMLVYIAVMMLPQALAMGAHGSTPELLTAALLATFCLFMGSIGFRQCSRYWSLSEAMFDLEQSRLSQQELLVRWRSVVENAPEIIATVGRDGCIDFINRTETHSPADLIGKPFVGLVAEAERERVKAYHRGVFETGQAVAFDTKGRAADGSTLGWYSCRVGPLIYQGEVEALVVIATNVTERHQMEQELRHSRAQLRRLAAHQQAALEAERRHIAREIHDELGQLLTALKIDIAWLERRLEDGPLVDRTAAMSGLVDVTINTVRRISSNLRPALLDELGPGPAVDWLVQDLCSRAGLKYRMNDALAGRPLDEGHSLAIFRICQEALNNVIRHAQASCVEVDLRIEGNRIILRVADDGIGISQHQVSTSLGLLGVQERVTLLGGSVDISGRPGLGTEIVVTIPFRVETLVPVDCGEK